MTEREGANSDANYEGNFVSGSGYESQHASQSRRISDESNIVTEKVNNNDLLDPLRCEDWEDGDLTDWDEDVGRPTDYFEISDADPFEGSNHLRFNIYPGLDQNGNLVDQGGTLAGYMKHDQFIRSGQVFLSWFRWQWESIDRSESMGTGSGFKILLPIAADSTEMFPDPVREEFSFHIVQVEIVEGTFTKDSEYNFQMRLTVENAFGSSSQDTTSEITALSVEESDSPFVGAKETRDTKWRKLRMDYNKDTLKAEISEDGTNLASAEQSHDNKYRSGGIAFEGKVDGTGGGTSEYYAFLDDHKLEEETEVV